jgi:hypothetical protein
MSAIGMPEDRRQDGGHASADEIALFVIDALGPAGRQRFEAHVAGCRSCGQALAAEAAAEQELVALWPSVQRPLAEVVPLARPTPPPAAVRRPARLFQGVVQGSPGGLAAALVALLFVGWWTDAGRNMAGMAVDGAPGRGLGLSGLSMTAGLVPGDALASADTGEDRVCAMGMDGPSAGALASWGMCTGGASLFGAGRCGPAVDPICRVPPAP